MVTGSLPAGRGVARETLLAVAAELFARKGYRATTLDDIAGELGLKKASLYHYIKSKDDLLCEIYQQIFDRIEAAVAPNSRLDMPVDERLRRMIHAHIQVVAAERDSLSVAFQEEAELPEDLQRAIRHRKRAHEGMFEKVIAEGQREGVFRPGSVRLMVLALLGMCNWMHKWYKPTRYSVDELAAEFALTVESGIRSGELRRGAWPRFGSVDEAFELAEQALCRTRADLERLEAELASARERLRDGLAGSASVHMVHGPDGHSPEEER